MKKKLSCLLLTLVLVVGALTGCMGSNTALVLNADGTCVYTVKYMYEKETFQTTLDEARINHHCFAAILQEPRRQSEI